LKIEEIEKDEKEREEQKPKETSKKVGHYLGKLLGYKYGGFL